MINGTIHRVAHDKELQESVLTEATLLAGESGTRPPSTPRFIAASGGRALAPSSSWARATLGRPGWAVHLTSRSSAEPTELPTPAAPTPARWPWTEGPGSRARGPGGSHRAAASELVAVMVTDKSAASLSRWRRASRASLVLLRPSRSALGTVHFCLRHRLGQRCLVQATRPVRGTVSGPGPRGGAAVQVGGEQGLYPPVRLSPAAPSLHGRCLCSLGWEWGRAGTPKVLAGWGPFGEAGRQTPLIA